MYELNTMYATSDRSTFDADSVVAREVIAASGGKDVLLCESVSGMTAGLFVWSARYDTLDAATASVRTNVALAAGMGDEGKVAIRSRYKVVARTVSRVMCEAGERRGPCMAVSLFSAEKPLTTAHQVAMDACVAAGGTGAVLVAVVEGEQAGNYYGAVFGDTLEQVDAAMQAGTVDERVAPLNEEHGLRRLNRIFFDVS